MFINLKAEMARTGQTNKSLSTILNTTDKTVSNKITGKTDWTRKEMFMIKKEFFPKLSLEYLFYAE